jgi:hypothetical protein
LTVNGNNISAVNSLGFRNRIINGNMVIDQRNAGAAVTAANQYTLDRWLAFSSAASKYTVQQGTTNLPMGFTNALNTVSATAYSVGASDFFMLTHRIEGFNIADLGWGTAGAQSVTLSFWVYSSLTGNFGGSVVNSAQTRSYPFLYNIPTANTPTKITITIPGDTSGTWLTNNGIGMGLNFGIGVGTTFSGTAGSWSASTFYSATGATSVVGTSGAIFNITGVQLEAGSVATPFEQIDYGRELIMCQRYYEILSPAYVMFPWGSGTQIVRSSESFKVSKRVIPTILMGTQIVGTGTLGALGATVDGVVYFGLGSIQDVVGYNTPTASAEL